MISPMRSRTRLRLRPSASTSATRSAEEALMGAVEAKQIDPSSKSSVGTNAMEVTEIGYSSPITTGAAGKRPPVECGDLNMRIARDGTWFYHGSLIGRLALVKLFASVLRRGVDGRYWLVTPAERGVIEVEDAPFVAVELLVANEGGDQQLIFRTNLDEFVTAGPDNPLRVETAASGEPAPYVLVRPGLEARLARPVFYELVELGTEEQVGDTTRFGVRSRGMFFSLGEPGPDWQ